MSSRIYSRSHLLSIRQTIKQRYEFLFMKSIKNVFNFTYILYRRKSNRRLAVSKYPKSTPQFNPLTHNWNLHVIILYVNSNLERY
jgi:hypothetical protein